ncbi:MAG: DUF4982 domain-containing protein [Treponema sp.]|nr:DUF4982 domain-containing protein [Treponema sp.]
MILFNKNWKFLISDPKNAHRPDYPDHTWKNAELPHDWVISRPFKKTEGGWTGQNMQGFFEWEETVWYRKEFTLADLSEKKVFVYFGGAYRNSTVYINGEKAAQRAYGYSSFEIDITEFVKEGKNIIAVRLDNGCEAPDRWYSGSGLFRNVFLKVLPQVHVKTWGVHIVSNLASDKKSASVKVEVAIESAQRKSSEKILFIKLLDNEGKCAAEGRVPFNSAKKEIILKHDFVIKNPLLWSAEEPNLYRAIMHIDDEQSAETRFGIRNIKIEYKKGMTVNGEKIKLKGVCLHHDCGITGASHYDSVWRRRLAILKDLGCNAIRTSHNTPAAEFLDLCDEMGFYVIDECFDKWKSGYYAAHFEKDAKRDLEDMVLRDRNHPCIFMWSIGNEVENQGETSMLEIQKKLVSIIRNLDDRPVTCGLSPHANPRSLVGAPASELVKITKKLAKDVDVLGLNYHEVLYNDYTKGIEKPIVGTECYEYYSSTALNFEEITEKNPWTFVLENDNVIGQFIWAGIDYLGECPWPAKGWAGSILDICGFLKPNAWFRKCLWKEEPVVYLAFYDQNKKNDYARGRWSFPPLSSHLNLKHLERRTVTAWIFTNCDEAELWINGKKIGKRKPQNCIIQWTFEYQSGEVKVTGFRNEKEVCSHELKTASEAKKILLKPDCKQLASGEIAHVEVNITDKDGILCPNEELLIEFTLTGDGEIMGSCSPDLNSNLGFTLPKVITSGGKALVMIKANSGTLTLKAFNEHLPPAFVNIELENSLAEARKS